MVPDTFDPRGWHEYFRSEITEAQSQLATLSGGAQADARARRAELQQEARRWVAEHVRSRAATREELAEALRDLAAQPAVASGAALPGGAAPHVKDYALYYLRKLHAGSWV